MGNKHLKTITKIILVLVGAGFLTSSCNDEIETRYESYGLVDKYEGNQFRILLDNNRVLNPRESFISGADLKDSLRLYISFNILEERDSSIDIRLNYAREILTKPILAYEESILDSIGNDPVKIYNQWIAHGFLNFEFMYAGRDMGLSQFPHMVNLLCHPIESNNTLELEFRHNAFNDRRDRVYSRVVSFPIEQLVKDMQQPIKIKVKFHDSANTSQTVELTYK